MGASEYLTKPFDMTQLRLVVNKWAGGHFSGPESSALPWRVENKSS